MGNKAAGDVRARKDIILGTKVKIYWSRCGGGKASRGYL